MPLPKDIARLVDQFHRNRDAYRSGQYNETQVRHEFIDPMFESLGWDINNRQGYAEAYKDVIHEDAIKVGGATKAPDYCFRIGGTRKFFLEAKKPSVRIHDDVSPAYQLRRYAWSAKLPLSVLTDFEEFALYDCRLRPAPNDSPATARVMYLQYTDYEQKWGEIASILSWDAIVKGSFDKYADSTRAKRGTAEVDAEFLKEIEAWRDALARNIAIRNSQLDQRGLNTAVQQTIDRIIFLRLCEDRGIEVYGRLRQHLNGDNVYARLMEVFRAADDRYNSGLFHFTAEKGRENYDRLTPGLAIDDKVLKDLIKRLYYPESPYEFSVLPADILGQVYEQFLGKVIRLTKGHQAKVEEKPEVRKAGGVYYTPTYIVDYIVKNTVGKLLENKSPKDIDGSVASRSVASRSVASPTVGSRSRATAPPLRVLDPACGSGSFLINAYQFLLDWYRDQYAKEPEKYTRARSPRLYQRGHNDYALTAQERKRILLDHIYGVDIDPQAVEVTKLSLLLKVLEGENAESIGKTILMFHERALPDLDQNIKCGNSLIGPDFYSTQQTDMFDEEEAYRINAFDWNHEFPFLPKDGGFDAVVGNPPYVRQESLGQFKQYFQRTYKTYAPTADLYVPFIERGVNLLRENGLFSYIVANKWMRANYGDGLRKWLAGQHIEEIVDFGDLRVFEKATTYPCILRICQKPPAEQFDAVEIDTLDFLDLHEHVKANKHSVSVDSLDNKGWSLARKDVRALLAKLRATGVPLSKYVAGKIYRGILTGLNEAFIIDRITCNGLIAADPNSTDFLKPFVIGRDIKRYEPLTSDRFIILVPSGWTNKHCANSKNAWAFFSSQLPAIAAHLAPFAEAATKRWDKGDYWWELRPCDYYDRFASPKIVFPAIVKSGCYTLDEVGFYSNDKTSILAVRDLFLLGILNSSLADLFVHSISSTKQGGYFEYKPMYVSQIPISTLDLAVRPEKARHDTMVSLVQQMLDLHRRLQTTKTDHDRTTLQRQITATDQQIDQLVYELYGLTKEEIAIVEGAGK